MILQQSLIPIKDTTHINCQCMWVVFPFVERANVPEKPGMPRPIIWQSSPPSASTLKFLHKAQIRCALGEHLCYTQRMSFRTEPAALAGGVSAPCTARPSAERSGGLSRPNRQFCLNRGISVVCRSQNALVDGYNSMPTSLSSFILAPSHVLFPRNQKIKPPLFYRLNSHSGFDLIKRKSPCFPE